MKCLTLIIHRSAKQDLLDHLLQASEISGFTIVGAEGHSERTGANPFDTTRDQVLGYVPRFRIDVLLEDEAVGRLVGGDDGAAPVARRLADGDAVQVGHQFGVPGPLPSCGL